jgi:predicted AAA+ superfamily ATPase
LIEVFYWRNGDQEVDFILRGGERVVAIEVKSNRASISGHGMDAFVQQFSPERIMLVGESGIPVHEFLASSVPSIFERRHSEAQEVTS